MRLNATPPPKNTETEPTPQAVARRSTMLFLVFVGYALSGYVIYIWRRAKGEPVSIVSTSTDEPDERGLHRD